MQSKGRVGWIAVQCTMTSTSNFSALAIARQATNAESKLQDAQYDGRRKDGIGTNMLP